jgi:hypothetical protein
MNYNIYACGQEHMYCNDKVLPIFVCYNLLIKGKAEQQEEGNN